jgi:hypothetical protein
MNANHRARQRFIVKQQPHKNPYTRANPTRSSVVYRDRCRTVA